MLSRFLSAAFVSVRLSVCAGATLAAALAPLRVSADEISVSSLRFNGAKVVGVRPGSPFLFRIAASGKKPLTFSAKNLPVGLQLDAASGIITGKVAAAGEYRVALTVKNASESITRELKIVVGETLALTPPMGWNSWYCWSESVSQENVLAMGRIVAEKLADHGWSYINIDDCWQGARGGKYGAIQANDKFPDMAGLGRELHALGLKMGIYSTPWMGSYAGFIGGSAPTANGDYSALAPVAEKDRLQSGQIFGRSPGSALRQAQVVGPFQLTDRDAQQYADWGVDYIKYDWRNSTFTSKPMEMPPRRTEHPKTPESIARLDRELRATSRDIVLSLSPIANWENRDDFIQHTNLWRITKDIKADWASLTHVFELENWFALTQPGHWPDPDMLQIGSMGVVNAKNRTLRPSPLSHDEQTTQMSFWCLISAPLLLSCDLTALDDFTLNLITNDEVIDLDQDSLGRAAKRVEQMDQIEIWQKPLDDGSCAIGIFNRGDAAASATVNWSKLNLAGGQIVRDLWQRQDIGTTAGDFTATINPHATRLLRIRPATKL